MLIEFTVGNFRSFKEKETFSMVAANLTSPDPELDVQNVISVNKDLRLLTSAAIYGRNASGKSNLLAALRFMRAFVLNSSKDTQATDPIPVEPFRLSTETRDNPSFFEVVFIVGGKQYRYGFEADAQRIVSEWLFTVPSIREAMLFQREGDEIEVASRFKEGRGLQERTRANALFLSVAAQFNGEIATEVVRWFRNLNVFGLDDWHTLYTTYRIGEKLYRDKITHLFNRLDIDIDDVQLEMEPHPAPALPDMEGMQVWIPAAKTTHKVYDENKQETDTEVFDLNGQESEGTKKLFAMAGFLFKALESGLTLFVDELDVKLHPLITRAIISLFNSKETNPNGAQLAFTTHDANLLDNKLLRRDQIWFVDKDRYGASHLVSLAEYRVRKEASFEKDYLQGRYGGIPSLGDLSGVFEETHA